jgi:hypothetical protein
VRIGVLAEACPQGLFLHIRTFHVWLWVCVRIDVLAEAFPQGLFLQLAGG